MSVFSNAKKIENVVKEPKKKDDKEKICVTGLAKLAAVDAVVKAFTALKSSLDEGVKSEMVDIFVGIGKQTKKRPENFRGIDGEKVSASCELRARSSASPLTPEETDLLDENKIPYETVEVKSDCYVINPAYFEDSELLAKVSAALEKVKGLPEDFILKQDKQTKRIVSNESIDAVFAKGLQAALIPIVCVPAVKPTFAGTLKEALDEVMELSGLAEEAAKKPAKAKKGA